MKVEYTRGDLVSFGEYLLSDIRVKLLESSGELKPPLEDRIRSVYHADIENWIHRRKCTETKRYFLVSTTCTNPNSSTSFNSFDVITQTDFPTISRCLEVSEELFGGRDHKMLNISELSEQDYGQFNR